MIVTSCAGYEQDVLSLKKELQSLQEHQVQSWMQYAFEPTGVFCLFDEDQLVGFLPSIRRTFLFRGRKAEAMILEPVVIRKEYDTPENRDLLWQAALDYGRKSCLITLYKTDMENGYEDPSFGVISTSQKAIFSLPGRLYLLDGKIRNWQPKDDLYSLYLDFMENFDGSVLLQKDQFERMLQYALKQKKQILVHENEEGELDGFYIAHKKGSTLVVEQLIYTSLEALQEMIFSNQGRWQYMELHVSGSENLQPLLGVGFETDGKILAAINHLPLFSVWQNHEYPDFVSAFSSLEKPVWNQMF